MTAPAAAPALVGPAAGPGSGMDLDTPLAQLATGLDGTDPAVQHLVDGCKRAGNQAFRDKRYREAVRMYTQAIAGASSDHTLYGNRSASHLALGLFEEAVRDARQATTLAPDWPKGHYRLGCALLGLSQWDEASRVLQHGLALEPGNTEMAAKAGEAAASVQAEAAARRAQLDTERRDIVAKLRAARRKDVQQGMVNQFKQSMAGPDWEVEDLEWRPTYMPAMRLKPLQPAVVLADPRRRLLAGFISALADLAYPKQALAILQDDTRLEVFQQGIVASLTDKPGADVLVLGAGTGLLSLLASQAGTGSVTAVERSRMLFRMAKQCLEANADGQHAGLVQRVQLLDRRLQAVGVQGEALPPDVLAAVAQLARMRSKLPAEANLDDAAFPNDAQQQGTADVHGVDAESMAALMPRRASVLVTDLLDHGVLGAGLLPSLDYAAERLLAPGAHVVPQRVQVYAMLLELRIGEVSGFDLSSLNDYWWHPSTERLDLDRLPHRCLSAPFLAHDLDLQARLEERQHRARIAGGSSIDVDRISETSAKTAETSAKADGGPAGWEFDASFDVPVTSAGHWNAVAFWFQPLPASSWGPAVQYVDIQAVVPGSLVTLRVQHDSGQYIFSSTPPLCRPRHALVPRWHFDMVLDTQRNEAYDGAISRAVQRKRAAGCAHLMALDLGAGSGLLSMMAARAGADEVYGTEMCQHMCDVGEEACIMNGFLGRVTLLDRDARRLDVLRKADGTPPDLPRRADLLVYEVFDSGCIGEGVLHILAAAQAKVVTADATLVPRSARVFCQPIQMRVDNVLGFDVRQANRWRYRTDYEGVELGQCREKWAPLADPLEVFEFDFRHAIAHMQPEQAVLDVRFNTTGVFNAVAMWFELQLDEDTSLSTSPYSGKGLTWQQAVQWVPEMEVQPGQQMAVTARHDTYSISYSLPVQGAVPDSKIVDQGPPQTAMRQLLRRLPPPGAAQKGASPEATGPPTTCCQPQPTGVPLVDPAWQSEYARLQQMNSELAKACVQNPLEYRQVALAAVQFAARPHDLGLDAQQAVEFCVKMMG